MADATLGIRRLTSSHLESRLRGAHILTRGSGWAPISSLSLDLSKCVGVDLDGATEALILLESAARAGIAVSVRSPALGVLPNEMEALRRLADEGMNIEKSLLRGLTDRWVAAAALESLGFWEAADLPHLDLDTAVRLQVDDSEVEPFRSLPRNLAAAVGALEQERAEQLAQHSSALVVPSAFRFRWVTDMASEELRSTAAELAEVMSQGRAEVVPESDALSIAHTIVYEALENVALHSADESYFAPAALIGAAFRRSSRSDGAPLELQLALADAGRGLAASLGAAYRPQSHLRYLPDEAESWPAEGQLVAWAFHPLSTSRPNVEGLPPTRGLSRTRHQVRYFGGSLRARTGLTEITWQFENEPTITHARGTQVPGTVLTIRLPIGSPADESPPGNEPLPDFLVLPIPDGSTEARSAELAADVVAHAPPSAVVVVIFAGTTVLSERGGRCARLIGSVAAQTLGHPTLALFPAAAGAELFAVLEAFAESVDAPPGAPSPLPIDPVLVVGGDRSFTLFGGTPADRSVLFDSAKRSGFTPPRARLAFADDALSEVPAETEVLLGWRQSLRVTGAFPISADNLHNLLMVWLREKLRSHVASGGEGVEVRDRLLGTLDVVERHVTLGEITQAIGITDLIGQEAAALARSAYDGEVSLVVPMPDVPDAMGHAFRIALAFDGLLTRIDPETQGWRMGLPPENRSGAAVVLGGVRYTGESLRAVVEQLLRWGIDVGAIVVVADAGSPANHLSALYREIPMITLASIDLGTGKTPVIDLVKIAEEATKQADSLRLPSSNFYGALATRGTGFSLVHVERSNSRHLVGYYDFPAMLRDEEVRDLIVDAMVAEIAELTADISSGDHLLCFPADDARSAGRLTTLIARRLGLSRPIGVARDPSTASGPDSGALWALDKDVTFVDWGAVTSQTARAALRSVVLAGARSARFVAMTSQLDRSSEADLRYTATLRRPAIDRRTSFDLQRDSDATWESVPVHFSTVTRVDPTHFSRSTCPLCITVNDLGLSLRDLNSPPLVAVAREKINALRPRSRDEALAYPRDLYNTSLTRDERSDITALWHELHVSLTSVPARFALLSKLETADADARRRVAGALCRILSARHDLLHSPPLVYARFRSAVAGLAHFILGAESNAASPLRRQAVVVLRAASKSAFVDYLPEVIRVNAHRRLVIAETLYSVNSILARPHYRGTPLLARLYEQLVECVDQVNSIEMAASIDADLRDTLGALLRRANRDTTAREMAAESKFVAWSSLRQAYGPEVRLHHHAINTLGQIIRRLDDYEMHAAIASNDNFARASILAHLSELWQPCAEFMTGVVLPSLARLRHVFSGAYYQQKTEPTDWTRWVALLESDLDEDNLIFPVRLDALRNAPGSFDENARAELLEHARWLARFFVPIQRLDATRASRPKSALLDGWLDECPISLGAIRDLVLKRLPTVSAQLDVRVADVGARVFCPQLLADEVITKVLGNFEEYAAKPLALDASSVVDGESGRLTIEFRNRAGVARRRSDDPRPSGGLAGLRRRLAPFESDLSWYREGADFVTSWTLALMEGPHAS